MAFQGLENDLLNIHVRHTEETLGGSMKRSFVPSNLHVRDGLYRYRDTLHGVGTLDLQRDRHYVEGEVFDLFEQRDSEGGATAHHPVTHVVSVGQLALASAQHGHHVRRHLQIVAAEERGGYEEREYDGKNY